MNRKATWKLTSILMLCLLTIASIAPGVTSAQGARRCFTDVPGIDNCIDGVFAQYWATHGGLAQQGYPISPELQERSATDGKVYTTQYFERAVFEHHPENQPPFDVLLSLLGVFAYQAKYPTGAPNQKVSTQPGARLFPETGHTVGGRFLEYWNNNGGLAQQGYPISEEFEEVSDLNGQTYTVQYFERAVFEYHPENQPPHDVLLSQLGRFRYDAQQNPTPSPIAAPTNTTRPNPSPTTQPTARPTTAPTAMPSPTPDPTFDPNKYYRLELYAPSLAGKCFDTSGNTNLVFNNCANSLQGQKWRITAAGGGTWKLSPQQFPSRCLDTQSLAPCSNASGQFWTMKPVGSSSAPGYYYMSNNFRGPDHCLAWNFNESRPTTERCDYVEHLLWKFTEVR